MCRLLRKPCGIGARLQMLVFAWLLACLSVSAQKHYMAHVHVGAHGGVSLSNVSFYPHIKEQLLPGMQMGVSFRYVEERHVGIMAEVNIEQRGWKENFEELTDLIIYTAPPMLSCRSLPIYFSGQEWLKVFSTSARSCVI